MGIVLAGLGMEIEFVGRSLESGLQHPSISSVDSNKANCRTGLQEIGLKKYPSVSVVVVGYNSCEWVSLCLASLTSQDYPTPYEILFVDNASSDDSADFVRLRFPTVRVIESGGNIGYSGGNNLGAHYATGKVLAFANPDTCADPSWLRELITPLVLDKSIGMTTSKIVLMEQRDVINACGNDVSLSGITTCRRVGERAVDVIADEDVCAVSGAACAIRGELFSQLGGFDEQFWMYLEDTDLSWRVRLAGYRCVLAANSVIAHDYRFQLSGIKTRVIERNRYLMLSKNLSVRSLIVLSPGFLGGEVVTWGWAITHGLQHVAAKIWAAIWMVFHIHIVWQGHRATQSGRRVSDATLLHAYRRSPAIAEVSSGMIGRGAQVLLTPIFIWTAVFSLALISLPVGQSSFEPSPVIAEAAAEGGSGD